MASPLTNNLPNTAANQQLQQDERGVQDLYNYNMGANDLNGLDMRAMQSQMSLLSVKAYLQTNMIKLWSDILKKVTNNIVP